MTYQPEHVYDHQPAATTSAFGTHRVPVCYSCRRAAKWITVQEWSTRSGEPLDSHHEFPLHLMSFWWCARCEMTGLRLLDA